MESSGQTKTVDDNIKFEQLMKESRRHRDRMMDIEKWHTTISFSFIGIIVAYAQLNKSNIISIETFLFLAVAVTIEFIIVSYLINYSKRMFLFNKAQLLKYDLGKKLFDSGDKTKRPPMVFKWLNISIYVFIFILLLSILDQNGVPMRRKGTAYDAQLSEIINLDRFSILPHE